MSIDVPGLIGAVTREVRTVDRAGRPARIRWIRRAQNLAGIALEKRRG